MKILIFTDCYIYGGSEKLMAFLLKNTPLWVILAKNPKEPVLDVVATVVAWGFKPLFQKHWIVLFAAVGCWPTNIPSTLSVWAEKTEVLGILIVAAVVVVLTGSATLDGSLYNVSWILSANIVVADIVVAVIPPVKLVAPVTVPPVKFDPVVPVNEIV